MDDLPQRRRDKRFQTRLPVRTRTARGVLELVAEHVSFRGLYLVTGAPPPVRQLIRLEATLPPDGVPFATHGMVVTVVPAGAGGRPPGCGVQFYGMGDERRAWEAYIRHVQRSTEVVADRRVSGQIAAAAAPPDASDARRFHRNELVLEVTPRDLDELVTMYSRDVSVGGMFLETTLTPDIGSELRLDVHHPTTRAVFSLSAVVRRHSATPAGLGVEFTRLDEPRRAAFFDFIHGFTDAPLDLAIEVDLDP